MRHGCVGLMALLLSMPLWSAVSVQNLNYQAGEKRVIVYEQSPFKSLGNGEESLRARVHKFDSKDKGSRFLSLMNKLPDVVHAEEDKRLWAQWEPGQAGSTVDPYYNSQWHYFSNSAGVDLPSAWDITRGSANVVVAVLDTGVLSHPDFEARLLPGYDFISDLAMAGDGNGRDSDASDSGDWVGPSESCYSGYSTSSSWHGTHVAGTIAAGAGNGQHVAGIAPRVRILPVRVLGKCGGWTSDIVDGLKWAAGLPVSGVATNPNPAKIINMSLGAPGSCTPSMQKAINDVRAKGVVVVVAAGNSSANLNYQSYTPANCQGVITVAAVNSTGDVSSYSNIGSAVTISAPGGENWNGVWSLGNGGTQLPTTHTARAMAGTSMAAPHVAGIAALMFSVKPGLVPSQVIDIIKDTSNSFASGEYCAVPGRCGAGLINAAQAVMEASITDTNGAVDNYHPAPVVGLETNQVLVRSSDSGGTCGTLSNDSDSSGGGPWGLALFLGLLAYMIPMPQKQKAKK